MKKGENNRGIGETLWRLLFALLFTTLFTRPGNADVPALTLPPGTILPVRLNSTISTVKSKPGQVITGRVMQDVFLASGEKIRQGSKIEGHIIEVTPSAPGTPAHISLQFDKLTIANHTTAVSTNLRAIAGFMRVLEAQVPTSGPGEGDVYDWLTTTQIGGDVVYGTGGLVGASDNANLIVGKSVHGGVVAQVRAKQGTSCRGPLDGNQAAQSLWLFSSDACGTYGLDHISIRHAGRTNPTGVIVLSSDDRSLKIPAGAGMLLRVTGDFKPVSAAVR